MKMKNDNINKLFERLQDDFDVETPNQDHKQRFIEKLNAQSNTPKVVTAKSNSNLWKPFLGIAASILLIVTLAFNFEGKPKVQDLASVSTEMKDTQNFFTKVIAEELEKIDSERTPETEVLIKDAMVQMETLEKEYAQLKLDLTESGNDKRVIHAMIDNFWNRINVLKTVLENIESIKTFKQQTNETSITL
ncbi:hypothetical protein [Lacinutrix chionoecetis]